MPAVRLPRLVALVAAAILLVGCGVRYRDPEPGTEFFSDIEVAGDMTVQAPLTVTVGFEQYYPAEVELVCELRQNNQTLRELGRQLVPPLEQGDPEATPVTGHATFDFTVDVPGDYDVECLTPKDEDNYISTDITVAAA
jgi:hypothetical protein